MSVVMEKIQGLVLVKFDVLYYWKTLFFNQDGHFDKIKLGDPPGNMIMDSLTNYISSWYYIGEVFHYRWSK